MPNLNFKGTSGLISLLIVAAIIGGLYYSFSFRSIEVERDNLNNSGLVDKNAKNVYADALKKAKGLAVEPMRPINETDYIDGSQNALAKLTVYMDYSCDFCVDYDKNLKQVKSEFGDKLVIAYRYFSLDSSQAGLETAQAAECAGAQNKYLAMRDKLLADAKNASLFTEQYLKDAADIGLDKNKFDACMKDKTVNNKIKDQITEAKSFGVIGVPSSYLNGQPLPGDYPVDDYKNASGEKVEGLRTLIGKILGK